jgi:hypothetical protein
MIGSKKIKYLQMTTSGKRLAGGAKCIFCNELESIEHLFLHCLISVCLWNCLLVIIILHSIAKQYRFYDKLKPVILYKDFKLCELIRGTFLWII